MRASAYGSTAASRENGGVSMVLCDAIVCSRGRRSKATKGKERKAMDTTTLLIVIVVVLLLFGGGGFYWRGRRR
jgi:hypothetical protein